ncbi:TPA: SDR family oxidoreductase [Burkholderia cepacia]|uniref:SDR family oxidoreductase n=1 Tax=Burkholderia cepacia TaxID=292 RepID=UPI001CF49861|nr:SDR family oxidoreductase [Burkholderia cepacia]MCA8357561.1 SDR family oxidoreductase [Burkholderia cepacia]HDR9761121.1 hypothetical protein [Burkholderia cepacia ATCC 25416]HDV6368328.1 hypothetical protein [Burkholderia cepacia]
MTILDDVRKTFGEAYLADAMRRGGGVGRTEDVAPIIAFMLSPVSGWIVGANLPVDGGLVASMQAAS